MTVHSPSDVLLFKIANSSTETVWRVSLDRLDRLVLNALRHLCIMPSSPNHPSWKAAHQVSKRMFILRDAALVAASLWQALRDVGNVRQTNFNFLPISKSVYAQTQMIMLCEGAEGDSLWGPANTLAAVLKQYEPVQQKIS